jgi:hypothetical protein
MLARKTCILTRGPSAAAAAAAGVGAGHVSAVSCVAFARRGGGFVASGGADKLLKVRWGQRRVGAVNPFSPLR